MLPDFQGLLLVGTALSIQLEGSFPCAQQDVIPQLKTTPSSCARAPRAWVCPAECVPSVGMELLQTSGSLVEGTEHFPWSHALRKILPLVHDKKK